MCACSCFLYPCPGVTFRTNRSQVVAAYNIWPTQCVATIVSARPEARYQGLLALALFQQRRVGRPRRRYTFQYSLTNGPLIAQLHLPYPESLRGTPWMILARVHDKGVSPFTQCQLVVPD